MIYSTSFFSLPIQYLSFWVHLESPQFVRSTLGEFNSLRRPQPA
jgi:hypothetical protein